ncbi:hypothetical protein K504DRAFT_252436 [Pleomassaria siparia CBS 279.74]|uniref:Uncharacterized protein n=1 Tax=Pleomassaria siparia CBS 279.74 TaxID=1314801 RepID=A0A6G1KCE7_9PLEO|nr:hypothetical protein K504DRAFT_252436 [Pleomassaria siparia CBS 279.74]
MAITNLELYNLLGSFQCIVSAILEYIYMRFLLLLLLLLLLLSEACALGHISRPELVPF